MKTIISSRTITSYSDSKTQLDDYLVSLNLMPEEYELLDILISNYVVDELSK